MSQSLLRGSPRRRHSPLIFALPFGAILLAAQPGRSRVIDDFEDGAFSLTKDTESSSITTNYPGLLSPLSPLHVIDGVRWYTIEGNYSDTPSVSLVLSSGDDGIVFTAGTHENASLTFHYPGGDGSTISGQMHADLSADGSDSLFLTIASGPALGFLVVRVEDSSGRVGLAGCTPDKIDPLCHLIPIHGPGVYGFPFSDFLDVRLSQFGGTALPIDFTDVSLLRFGLHSNSADGATYVVTDFRSGVPEPGLTSMLAAALAALLVLRTGSTAIRRDASSRLSRRVRLPPCAPPAFE